MAGHPLNYEPFPSVNPAGAPGGDEERIQASPEAFGASVGRAKETLGQGLETASNQGFSVAEMGAKLQAETHAAELHSWQSDQVTDAQEKFLSLRGKAALMALPDYKKQIDDIHQQALDQSGNAYTKNLVNVQGRRLNDITYAGAARHAAQQSAVWQSTTARDAAAAYGNQAVLSASQSQAPAIGDDLDVQRHLFNSDQERRNHAELEGYESPAIDQEVAKNRGTNVKTIVEQIANDGSPNSLKRANDFYKAQEEKIDAGSRLQIQNFLKGPLNTVFGQKRADEHMERPPQASPPSIVADVPASFIGGIKQSEGYRAHAYPDGKQYSIGFGTKANSPDEVIDQKEAESRFNKEITKAAKVVDALNPNLDPGTRAALTSLTYNTGDAWTKSGLGEKIRSGDIEGAKQNFLQYNKVDGAVNETIAQRRAREASWFGRGDISATEASAPNVDKGTAMLRVMNDPDLANRPQAQAAALTHINKVYEAYHLQSAQDNASFKLQVANSTAEALDTGRVTNPIGQERFIQALGAEHGAAAYSDYQANIRLGADMRTLGSMTPQETDDLLHRYEPQPGPDYINQAKRSEELRKAIAHNAELKKGDIADFMIRRTDFGSQAYRQFSTLVNDPKATPDQRKVYAASFADKMLAEQDRIGVDPADRKILPKWYLETVQKGLASPDAEGGARAVRGEIQKLSNLWGDHWPDVYHQLAPDMQPLARMIGAGIKPQAAEALINAGIKTKDSELFRNEEKPDQKIKDIAAEVNSNLANYYHSLSGTQQNVSMTDARTIATRLAILYMHNNVGQTGDSGSLLAGDYKESAKQAVHDLIDFKYDYRDTYRVPKDSQVDPDLVQAGLAEAKRALGAPFQSNQTAADAEMQLTPQERALYDYHVKNLTGSGKVTNPDGSISTIKDMTIESEGRTYVIPSVYEGKILSNDEAWNRAKTHLQDFPSYASEAEADKRYGRLHDFMGKDMPAYAQHQNLTLAPVQDQRFPGRSAEDLSGDYADRMRQNGVWLTSAKEKGLILYQPDGQPAARADGSHVLLTWQQLKELGEKYRSSGGEAPLHWAPAI